MVLFNRGVHGDGNGTGGGVAEAVDVDDDAVEGEAEALGGGEDDALVGLVGDEAAEVGTGEAVAGEDCFGDLGHLADGELVDGLTVLVDEVLLGVDGGVAGGKEAAAGGHVESGSAGAVDFVEVVDEADFAGFAGFEEDGTGTVAEDDAGGAVGVVDDGAHDVGTDDHDLLVGAGFDEFCADLESKGEA